MSLAFGPQQSVVGGPLGGWVGGGRRWLEGRKEGVALLGPLHSPAVGGGRAVGTPIADSTVPAPGGPPADHRAEPAVDLPGDARPRHPV